MIDRDPSLRCPYYYYYFCYYCCYYFCYYYYNYYNYYYLGGPALVSGRALSRPLAR